MLQEMKAVTRSKKLMCTLSSLKYVKPRPKAKTTPCIGKKEYAGKFLNLNYGK